MPSAPRRTVSSSSSSSALISSRTSPYPAMTTRSRTAALNAARRTETTSRQVLADIEWWRVVSGQEPGVGNSAGDATVDDVEVALAGNAPALQLPIEDMENIDIGIIEGAAAYLTPSSPASSAPSSRGATPPRGAGRSSPPRSRRAISFAGFDMTARMNARNTNQNELPSINDNDNESSSSFSFDTSARRI